MSKHPIRSKPRLRNVRLEIPKDKIDDLQAQSKYHEVECPRSSVASVPFFVQNCIATLPIQCKNGREITLFSPSPFFQFRPDTIPEFVYEVFMPHTAKSFTNCPSKCIERGRFLVYVTCTRDTIQRIPITVNGRTFQHITGNSDAIDITDLLLPMNAPNWIIADVQPIFPILLIGVWVSYISIEKIMNQISASRSFIAPISFDLCPISRSTIRLPAKGVDCCHDECFDAYAFMARATAVQLWTCPICGKHLTIERMMVDSSKLTKNYMSRASSEGNFSSLL